MAFETFLTQSQAQPTRRRRLTYLVSLILHGALLAFGIVYSFWHVDELSPPTVRVTFMTAAPPPPPPPPPAAAGGAPKKKVAIKPKEAPTLVQPKPGTLLQPAEKKKEEKKKEEDDDDEPPGGIAGGKKGGTIGGTIGGTPGGTIGGTVGGIPGGTIGSEPVARPVMLTENMGAGQRLPGQPDPPFPAILRRKAGAIYVLHAKICVNKTGNVDGVTLLKKADPMLDESVTSTVKTWRYHPRMTNTTPVPFCYIARFEFKAD